MPGSRNNLRNRVYDPTELYGPDDRIFRLRIDSMGRLSIDLVNADGDNRTSGHILGIESSGHLYRYISVNARAGFPRDREGRVRTSDEEYQEHEARRNT